VLRHREINEHLQNHAISDNKQPASCDRQPTVVSGDEMDDCDGDDDDEVDGNDEMDDNDVTKCSKPGVNNSEDLCSFTRPITYSNFLR